MTDLARLRELYAKTTPGKWRYPIWRDHRHSDTEWIVAAHNSFPSLDAELTRLRKALEGLVDDEPCCFDHHGYCQTHGPGPIPCQMAVARAALTTPGEQ
jgi:hypothetical protein